MSENQKRSDKEEILEMNRLLKVIFPDFPSGYLDGIISKNDTNDFDELKYDMRKENSDTNFSIVLKGEKYNEDNSNENTKDENGDGTDISDFMVDPNDEEEIFSDSIEIDKSIRERILNTYKDIYDSDVTGLKEMASSDSEFDRWIFYYPDLEKYDEQ